MNSNLSLDSLKSFWFQIVGFFVLVALVALIVIPGIQNITANRKEIESMETLKNKYDQKITILKAQNVSELNEYLTNSLVALPSSYSSPTVLNSLEKLGAASGISFNGLQASSGTSNKASASTTSSDFSTYGFSLSTTTDYSHAILMLKNFENTLPLFNINNITLLSGTGVDNLSLSFSVETYYKSLPEDIGTKDASIQALTDKEKNLLAEIESYSNYPLTPDTSGTGKTNPFD